MAFYTDCVDQSLFDGENGTFLDDIRIGFGDYAITQDALHPVYYGMEPNTCFNTRDENGMSALDLAVSKGWTTTVKLLLRCPRIDDSGTDYSHLVTEDRETMLARGQSTCPKTKLGNLLFIIGGREENEADSNKIYVVSLHGAEVPSCFENITDFPAALNYPSTAILPDGPDGLGLPTVCGGGSFAGEGPFESMQWPDTLPTSTSCYQLNPAANSPSWVQVGSKNPAYAAGVFILLSKIISIITKCT